MDIIIIWAVLALGLLICIHELGHFITAKLSGVKVLEFTIGFGPAVFKKEYKGTLYAIRIIPLGGAVMMEGEDEDSQSDGAFCKAPLWRRIIIVAAGAIMNLLLGFLILFCLYFPAKQYSSVQIADFMPGFEFSDRGGFQKGDIITEIDGYKILLNSDISFALEQNQGRAHDFKLIRDGQKVVLYSVPLEKKEYTIDGQTGMFYGLRFEAKKVGFADKFKLPFYGCVNFVRIIWLSLKMLFSGAATVADMSGPVAITSAISGAARQSATLAWYFIAFISVNLGVMNLLPLPALDGGRLVFLIIEAVRGKPINPKYEGIVHMIGMVLFIGLFLFVTFNDIIKLAA